jgi:phosphotransferase system HPr (HPr) family protein
MPLGAIIGPDPETGLGGGFAVGPGRAAPAAFARCGDYLCAESVIRNRLGLHSRAAARLAQAIEDFDCEIYLEKGDYRADARSILDLLSLCCPCNTKVTLLASGPEAERALETARRVIHDRFGEEE